MRPRALLLSLLVAACGSDGDAEAPQTPPAGASAGAAGQSSSAGASAVAGSGGGPLGPAGGAGGAAGGGDLVLPGGVRVDVDDAGHVSLWVGDRALLSLSKGASITGKTFTETHDGLTAIWVFEREDEESFAIDKVREVRREGDAVVIELSGDKGEATLTVRPHERPDATRLKLEVRGIDRLGSIALPIACDEGSTFHGFGEQYNGTNQRGEAFTLLVSEQGIGRDPAKKPGGINGDLHTTYFPMPYYVDARGHGVLLDTARRVNVDLCKSQADTAWFEVVGASSVEAVVFHGPTTLDVVKQLGDEVGRPKAPPPWAFGLWLGAQGGRDAVLARLAKLEQAGVKATALWAQDWTGKRMNLDGGYGVQYRWVEDPELYPDIKGMIDELHGRGYRFLSYANPFVIKGLEHFAEMDEKGYLAKKDGKSYSFIAPNGASAHPDLTNPDARAYVKGYIKRMVQELGTDGFMADFGEWLPLDAELMAGGDPIENHNRYPVEWHRTWREVVDEVRPDGDFAIFARSGFTGVQRVSQMHWVGDQECTWSPHDGLPTVVPAMLNLGLAGVAFVTLDIAGFSGGPSTKELYQRWVELGAFAPTMRTHDGNKRELNWAWDRDEETTAHFKRFAALHELLRPEIEAAAAEAAVSSKPVVRHLMLMFPEDVGSRDVSDQFMLGDSLLVAPVVTEGATTREVYLPPGAWYHVMTGQKHEGGGKVTVDAPVGMPPVFSRGVDRPELRAM